MEWILQRTLLDKGVTLGEFFDEADKFICNTLEPAARTRKIYGDTCIPSGRYKVEYTWSGRFNRNLPLLVGVPGYTGIRIHSGNTTEDTDGCVIVGQTKAFDSGRWYLRNSILAKEDFCRRVEAIKVPLYCTVKGGYSAAEMGLA